MVLLYAFTLPKEDKCSICILNVPSIRPRDQLLRLLRLPPTETIALKWYLFHLLKLLNLKGLLKKSRYVLNYFQRSKMCLGINWILNIWSRFVAWISDDYFESFSPLSNVVTEGLKTSLCNRLKIRLPDLLSKIIFRHWNCYLSSFATDGKDEHGLKNKKFGPTFSSFDAMVAKRSSKIFFMPSGLIGNSFDIVFNTITLAL